MYGKAGLFPQSFVRRWAYGQYAGVPSAVVRAVPPLFLGARAFHITHQKGKCLGRSAAHASSAARTCRGIGMS
jgi:hypothetical protein